MRRVLSAALLLGLVAGPAAADPKSGAGSIPFDTNAPAVRAQASRLAREKPVLPPRGRHLIEDHSGRREVGKASVYSERFAGRHMADGNRFHQTGSAAASKSLPLGTVAKVTNEKTGKTAVVTIEDHGPYRDGRAIDVSRATAARIGLTKHDGVTPVTVAPVAVPQADGSVTPGAGALPGGANAAP